MANGSDLSYTDLMPPDLAALQPSAPVVFGSDPSIFKSRGASRRPATAPEPLPSTPTPSSIPAPPTDASAASDVGQTAATPSPLGPVLGRADMVGIKNPTPDQQTSYDQATQPSRWALMKPPGNYQPAQSYGDAAADLQTGAGTGQGMTKLGKLLTILRGAATGAIVGSTQPTLGTGLLAAQQNQQQTQAFGQQQQLGALNLQMMRSRVAMLPVEQQMQQLQLENQKLALQGYQPVMRQEPDGSFSQQVYDRLGNPVGKPIKNIISPQAMTYAYKPHLQPTAIMGDDGFPTYVNFNKLTGKYEDQDGTELPNQNVRKYVPPAQSAVIAQAGAPPGPNATPEQRADYGRTLEQIQTRMKREGSASLLQPDELAQITGGIISGDLPPDITRLGLGRGAGGQVDAELMKQGFNLTQANQDWKATQRYLATLNGSQQVLFQQRVRSAGEMLNNVDQLYKQWQQTGLPSGYKAYNRAALQAAKNLPGQAGATAQALDTQIAELTADLATVYMGGSSPSDKGIGLAHEVLSGDWNEETFAKALQQARTNVAIRINSVRNGTPTGVSANSPYIPTPAAPPATDQGGGGNPPAAPKQGRGLGVDL